MHPLLHLTRLVVGFLFLIVFARLEGSSLPPIGPWHPQNNGRYSREIDAEVARLSAQLKSSDVEERRNAILVLSHLDGDSATSALVSVLADKSPAVRALALSGLGERSDNTIVPPIAARLSSDKDAFVRKAAAYALGNFTGQERTTALIAALRDKDQEVRGAAAVSLGRHADATAVAPLALSLSDKNDFVRAQTARALGINGKAATAAVPALVRLLDSDSEGEVKRQAATALGLIGDRSALPALERAARNSDSYLAQAARDSIRMFQGK